jgi:hypothetical protein
MNRRPLAHIVVRIVVVVIASIASLPAQAQFEVRPTVGIQTIIFNGDNQARRAISPGNDVTQAFGGGLSSANNGAKVGIEIVPDPAGLIRIPISAEYYWFDGKTTFAVPSTDRRVQQLRLQYSANMLSVGAGVKAAFVSALQTTLYLSAEGRFNYIPPTTLTSRRFYLDNGSLVSPELSIKPTTEAQSRFGAVVKFGTQADFFDPVLLDFSIGYGAINLGGKNTDPETERDILVAEPTLTSTERTLGYITVGLSVLWQF